MKDQRDNARHHLRLRLALAGLMSAAALTLGPARLNSAQEVAGSWSYTGNLNTARWAHTATLLPNGNILVAGGRGSDIFFLNSSELFDPAAGTWSTTGNLNSTRGEHTATLLANGKVLLAGGKGNCVAAGCSAFPALNTAELYDPATGTWSSTGSLNFARSSHTATLLSNGNVLVTGGYTNPCGFFGCTDLNSAELYDPVTGTWSVTATFKTARTAYSATLLPSGKVLVAGGSDNNASAELYDPTTGTWSDTGSLNTGQGGHSATLLPNGKVLIAGGSCFSFFCGCDVADELYDPPTGTWTITGNLNEVLGYGTPALFLNGQVLFVGNSSSIYDPATETWRTTANPNTTRGGSSATLLADGRVLVAGGLAQPNSCNQSGCITHNSAELYDPGTTPTSTPTPTPTSTPTPTPTVTPTATPTPTSTPTPAASPSWTFTGNLNTGRQFHTTTLLPNGKVLVAGGNGNNGTLKSAELYDPVTGTWSNIGNLNTDRAFHTATLLPNGKVLVAGGFSCAPPPASCFALNNAELYDPATGTWSSTGNLNTARDSHTATLLNGKVLIAGGFLNGGELNSAELYDPSTGIWSITGNLSTGREWHTATLLQNSKVLVAGGLGTSAHLNSAELYDPATGTWSNTGNLNTAHELHTATLLPNGKVLVAAGFINFDTGQVTNSSELYDLSTGTWNVTGNLNQGRAYHTATLLAGGKVLVAGGFFVDGLPNITNSAELYDPATGIWSNTATLNSGRRFHTATLLLSGKVLAAGGSGFNASNSAELYDPRTNPIDDAQFFVRQHYLDFLNREPDADGLAYWTDRITQCGSDARCIHERRIGVSAAFFIELEFQDTGYYVYRFYKASFGRQPNYAEFSSDRSKVIGSSNLEASKQAFADEWVQRAAFLAAYPNTMSNTEVVNKLFDSAGLTASRFDAQRQQEIAAMNAGRSRALVLRDVIEIPDFKNIPDPNNPRYSEIKQISQYNPAFVLMQYFGYLHRDLDRDGYDFWLDVVNNREPNNYHGMVCSFITSTEYQLRFGSSVTRNNVDCSR